jgi:CheY-like chemotaxis protein/anti-sigma regulatory factor (Ser/Thr protein kinase)
MAASKGVGLHASLTDSAIVNADAYRLQQVASNLLSNAVKFTPTGGEVHLTLSQRDDQAVLVVQDTGQGIAPELLPHIFDRFRQGDGSSTRAHGGLGLGLAIVRHIVRAHEGAIEAHSDGVNRGATFTVTLPLMDAAAAATSLASPRAAFDGGANAKLNGLLALIVDDEPDSRELLSCALQEAGADVVVAADGLEALGLLMAHQPNVLLTDVQMPQMDGFALLAAVRERLQAGAPPAIAITARASNDDALRAAEAGFAAHLTKPVDLNLLMDTIRRVSGAV